MHFLFPEAFLAPTCYWIMHKHLSLDPETLIDLFPACFPYLVSYYLSQQVAFANFLLTQITPSHWPASFLLITHLPYLLFAFPNSTETFTLLFCFPITFYLFWDNCTNLALILTLPSLIPTSYIQSKFPVMTKYLWIYPLITTLMGFPGGTDSKESAWNAGELAWSLGQEDPLEKEMATHSSILAWKILQTEKPGGIQSMGSQRIS